MTKDKLEKLIDRWTEIKVTFDKLEKEQAEIRLKLIKEVDKEYPDKTRSARIEVGDFNVIRSEVPKVNWNLTKFKDLIGQSLYEQVIKTKITVDEEKVDSLIKEGKIDKKDVYKVTDVKYQERLLVNLKSENDKEEGKPRSFIEEMDY